MKPNDEIDEVLPAALHTPYAKHISMQYACCAPIICERTAITTRTSLPLRLYYIEFPTLRVGLNNLPKNKSILNIVVLLSFKDI